jgi:hypothetical protein
VTNSDSPVPPPRHHGEHQFANAAEVVTRAVLAGLKPDLPKPVIALQPGEHLMAIPSSASMALAGQILDRLSVAHTRTNESAILTALTQAERQIGVTGTP